MKNKIIISSLTLWVLTFFAGLYGASYHWVGSGNDFNDPNNWDGTPNFNVTNNYIFNRSLGTQTIELTGNVQNASLRFNADYSGDVTLDLKNYTMHMNGFLFFQSTQGTALSPEKVTIRGGGQSNIYAIQQTGNMDVTFDGVDFNLYNTVSHLYLSNSGNTLTLENGSKLVITTPAATTKILIGKSAAGQTASNNLMIVNGAGTLLSAGGFVDTDYFAIGESTVAAGTGSYGNELRIENGGTFIGAKSNFVGHYTESSNNQLTVTGSGSSASLRNTYVGTMGFADSKDNQIIVSDQGLLTNQGFLQVGGDHATSTGNKLSVSGEGTVITEELRLKAGSEIEFSDGLIAVGKGSYDDAVTIGDGATGTATYRMANVLDKTHTFNQTLTLSANARLEGLGTLNGVVYTNSGAVVSVGINDGTKTFGILTIDSAGSADWDNEGVELIVSLGDLSSGVATAGVNHDLLTLGSHYTLLAGGNITVDLSNYVLFDEESPFADFKVVSWSAYDGDLNDIHVAFDGGSALTLGYRIEGDGLYITAVPEPSTVVSMFGGVLLIAFLFRRKCFC